MKISITFNSEAHSGGTGWFDFDPMEAFDWSFEETVARIHRLAEGQDMFESQEKSSFDAVGFIHYGAEHCLSLPFIICDWREDKRIHVLLGREKPEGLREIDFQVALMRALAKAEPKEFSSTYTYSEDVFSWPPTPSKEEAVKMAVGALKGLISDAQKVSAVERALAAIKALEEAF